MSSYGGGRRDRSWVTWAPLALLGVTELCVWFVTTVVVLLPLVVPGFSLSLNPGYRANRLESAVGWLLLLVYQILFVMMAVSVARTVLTPPGDIPSWLRSDGRSDLHSYSNLLQVRVRVSVGDGVGRPTLAVQHAAGYL